MKITLIILAVFAVFEISSTEAQGYMCPSAGYFQNINDCKSYILCYPARDSDDMELVHFTCPPGKAYDHVHGYCSKDAFKNCISLP